MFQRSKNILMPWIIAYFHEKIKISFINILNYFIYLKNLYISHVYWDRTIFIKKFLKSGKLIALINLGHLSFIFIYLFCHWVYGCDTCRQEDKSYNAIEKDRSIKKKFLDPDKGLRVPVHAVFYPPRGIDFLRETENICIFIDNSW